MRRATNVPTQHTLSRFSRVRQSFRQGAQHVREDVCEKFKKVRKVPRWMRILETIYHEYGLKHVCLISILIIYQFIGAGVFYFCEAGFDESKEKIWNTRIAENRTKFVFDIIPLMFNNTDYLFFITQEQTNEVSAKLHAEVRRYEKQLGIKYTDQKIKWDFWNAMLYAQTICTTIGYGHLYPSTVAGRVFTMIYAIFGIPLVLSILDDLDLDIFDLPIPIAITVVISWIFICSATFCIWEHDWDYFVAFYFFFISLSTIGLGDITPTQPKYLLMLFIYIIIGLSLVSMCINLIQAKLERTYEAGRMQQLELEASGMLLEPNRPQRRGSSLGTEAHGVFRSSSSVHSLSKEAVQAALANRKRINKTSQTVLSFPSPSSTNAHICKTVSSSKMRFLPRTLSIDDVMQMVDTEDGDILVLTDLVREESGISQNSGATTSSSDESNSQASSRDVIKTRKVAVHLVFYALELFSWSSKASSGDVTSLWDDNLSCTGSLAQVVVSKSFDANLFQRGRMELPETLQPGLGRLRLSPSRPSVVDIEALEELEDRIALGQASQLASAVHFRSRLSLIPEQVPSTVEECEEPSEDSHALSEENTDSPPTRLFLSEFCFNSVQTQEEWFNAGLHKQTKTIIMLCICMNYVRKMSAKCPALISDAEEKSTALRIWWTSEEEIKRYAKSNIRTTLARCLQM
ncbi:Ion channel [Ancylostoma ceylanicum]|uniref:Ion channel n=1 Tax=Ancylostoma ceylanicum TaxID=53326 RepID=A0A0D6LN24_9BILA|nr:Ion channel [Ancylostoma ceylanicum]